MFTLLEYFQVIYKLQLEDGDEGFFTLNTVNGQAVVKLVKPLDYERKFLHQIKVLAMDRAETEAQVCTYLLESIMFNAVLDLQNQHIF